MRHRVKKTKLNRDEAERRSLTLSLIKAVIDNGSMETTLPKAKFIEPELRTLINLAQRDTLSSRRILISRLGSKTYASRLKSRVSQSNRFRILKLGKRIGDGANMASVRWIKNEDEKKE